jgi:hypothetical protein
MSFASGVVSGGGGPAWLGAGAPADFYVSASGSIQTFVSHMSPPHLQMFEPQEPLEAIEFTGALESDI